MSPSDTATRHAPVSLLESGLRPEQRPGGIISRPRLLSKLDRFSGERLLLVTAPAGYGKTSLLATWAARKRPDEVAWLTLERRDCTTFWRDVAETVERARPRAGARAAAMLRARGAAPEVAVHELLADLTDSEPLTIVLDDLHVVEDKACFELLAYVLEHLPRGVAMVAGARADPPLPLGRLRARGLLEEIRARDLAFTVDETRELLVHAEGLDLHDDEIELLVERTEGWPVALYLTALWLRDEEEPRLRVRELAAGQRFLGEYLTDEILSALDTSTRSFLVRTSVLTYLSAPLCDSVLERDDSAEMLRRVSSANLLITALEPGSDWFRVHRLFRDLLRLELEREEPLAVVELHRRAAGWLQEHGYLEGTVAHATEAGEHDQAAAVISENWERLLSLGEGEALLRLVAYLPLEVVTRHPELAGASALATYHARRPVHERLRWIAVTERSRTESPETWSPRAGAIAALARAIAVDDDVGEAAAQARRALRIVQRHQLPDGAVTALSALAYALYLEGRPADAGEAATKAMTFPDVSDRPHGVVRSLGVLALVAADSGSSGEAASKAHQAIEYAADHGLSAAASTHVAHLARARVMLTRGHRRAAEGAAELAERLCRMPDPSVPHALTLIVLAEARARNGDLQGARAALADAKREIASFRDPGRLSRSRAAAERLIRATRKAHASRIEPLSPAEVAVLRLLATELSQSGIGHRMFLSVNTVKTHKRSIYRKLGVTSRADAVARAAALGLIPK